MKSRETLPLKLRPSNGEFKKLFSSKYFEELLILTKNYHFALSEAEEELLDIPEFKSTILQSEKIFPKRERLPFDKAYYNGVSKLQYYIFCDSVKKYHNALTISESILEKHGKEKISTEKEL